MPKLKIAGMHCASCARRVQESISSVPGVKSCAVNFAAGTAYFTGSASLPSLQLAVEKSGYSVVADQLAPSPTTQTKALFPSLLLGIPAIVIGMWHTPPETLKPLLQGAGAGLASALVFVHRALYARALRLAVARQSSMETLIALGTAAAFAVGYFEAVAGVLTFFALGKHLEAIAKESITSGFRQLDIAPTPNELAVGSEVALQSAQVIPADCRITQGQVEVDESLLTGEPLPVAKTVGAYLYRGTRLVVGSCTGVVTSTAAQSVLARVQELAESALLQKPKLQQLADDFARYLVPLLLLLAAAVFFWNGLAAALAVLLIACPCALGLATPIALYATSARAIKDGTLITNSGAFAQLALSSHCVFDKTGTLTTGLPEVTLMASPALLSNERLREIASLVTALERGSEHPLGRALSHWAAPYGGGPTAEISNLRLVAGRGLEANSGNKKILLGSPEFLGVANGEFSIGLSIDEEFVAAFSVQETLRPEAAAVITQLRALGVSPLLLSGDQPRAVEAIARKLDLDPSQGQCEGGLLPQTKLERISGLRAQGAVVVMVGDGFNDAPALGAANVGIALPSGSGLAIETADLVLLRGKLTDIPRLIQLARLSAQVLRQNLSLAFVYNFIAIPVAALGYLTPALASLCMALSSLSVVLNSTRLLRWKAQAD